MTAALDRIIDLTFDISRIMRHKMMCLAKEDTSVNFLQIHALVLIENHEGMTMKELADALYISRPSATSFINRLVKLKWVDRFPDLKNRKLVRLRLSNAGKDVVRTKMAKRRQVMKGIIGALPPDEQKSMATILHHLHDILSSHHS